ncbi:hypothetical protein C8R47DRAFT_1155714 [Mycena vitilis]|nr:hypothetical protein C8R47DRAFT_1155714 [Mycena vitilis]
MLSPLVLPHGWLLLSPFWPCRLTILERRPAASDLVPTPFVGSLSSFPTPFCDPASFPPRSRLVLISHQKDVVTDPMVLRGPYSQLRINCRVIWKVGDGIQGGAKPKAASIDQKAGGLALSASRSPEFEL